MRLVKDTFKATAAVTVAAVLTLAGQAGAQQVRAERVMVTLDGASMSGGTVSKRSLERFAEVLRFSTEQKESALAIHEGYVASMKDVQKARSVALEDLHRSSQDSGDHGVYMEKFPVINKEFKDKSTKLEKALFDDLKSLCAGAEQEGRWPKVERMRRREVELRQGGLSGENLDLVDIVSGLKLAPALLSEVAPTLDEYEVEVDGHLKVRQQLAVNAPKFDHNGPPDMDAIRKSMADSREVGLKIKGVNERFARRIAAVLPETEQESFNKAVRQGTYPQVYRRSPIVRDIDKALSLGDLTTDQRAALSELKESYEREVKPANDAWAAAIEESDTGEGAGAMPGPGGGSVMVRMGDEPEPLKAARKARREVDDKARQKIRKMLSEAQQEAIKPKPGEDGEAMELGEGMMIRAVR